MIVMILDNTIALTASQFKRFGTVWQGVCDRCYDFWCDNVWPDAENFSARFAKLKGGLEELEPFKLGVQSAYSRKLGSELLLI